MQHTMSTCGPQPDGPPSPTAMRTLGVDPDSRDLAMATWGDGEPVSIAVVHVVGSASNYEVLERLGTTELPAQHYDRIAIEGQQIDGRRTGRGDLFKLAHITGGAILWCKQQYPEARLVVPTPWEWKRGVPKSAMQARLYDRLGWGYEMVGSGRSSYALPVNAPSRFSHVTKGQWKHAGDALLLAKWAHDL